MENGRKIGRWTDRQCFFFFQQKLFPVWLTISWSVQQGPLYICQSLFHYLSLLLLVENEMEHWPEDVFDSPCGEGGEAVDDGAVLEARHLQDGALHRVVGAEGGRSEGVVNLIFWETDCIILPKGPVLNTRSKVQRRLLHFYYPSLRGPQVNIFPSTKHLNQHIYMLQMGQEY